MSRPDPRGPRRTAGPFAVDPRDQTPPPSHAATGAARFGWVVWVAGGAVAAGAAVATAHGLYEVAVAARVPRAIAWLYPLITDGLALVAYAATSRLAGAGARYAWSVVVLAAGLSGLAQAAYLAADPRRAGRGALLRFGIGAWPAIAAAITAHLLYLLATPPGRSPAVGAVDMPLSTPPTRADPGAAAVPAVGHAALPGLTEAGEHPGRTAASDDRSAEIRARVHGPAHPPTGPDSGPYRPRAGHPIGRRAGHRPWPGRPGQPGRARPCRGDDPPALARRLAVRANPCRHRRRRPRHRSNRPATAPRAHGHRDDRDRGHAMTRHRARLTTHQHKNTTATQSNASKRRDYTECRNKSRRSTAAHLGITIRRGGPASGRPPTARNRRCFTGPSRAARRAGGGL